MSRHVEELEKQIAQMEDDAKHAARDADLVS